MYLSERIEEWILFSNELLPSEHKTSKRRLKRKLI